MAVVVLSILLLASLADGDDRPPNAPDPGPTPAAAPASYAPFGYTVVPNFVGMTGDQASGAASAADFRGVNFTQNYASMSSKVVTQSPPAGTTWNKIEPISITLDPESASAPAYSAPSYESAPAPPHEPPSTVWTYKVTGKNRGSITYSGKGGNSSQATDANLPWTKKVDSPGYAGMDFAYVSAQNSGGGSISCQIINPSGDVVAENTAEGEYAIVTCQA